MKPWLYFTLTVLGLSGFARAEEKSAAPKRTILVLDASGSMWGRVDGRAKIEIAREVIGDLVGKLPADTELGLVTYGHRRKGDCADIELLVPPGGLDREAFMKTVNGIMPKGMTPLTAAVEFAAEGLRYTENEATVILVTDGEETCDRDPCAAALALEQAGVNFTAHVIAFDLTDEAAKSVECLAKNTGGLFLKAANATTLTDALEMAITPEEEPAEEEAPADATVKGPESVVAGAEIPVEWTGPDDKGDYITIVPAGTEDGDYKNYEYTRRGSPLKLTALIEKGDAELRYMHGRTRKVLGRAAIKVVEAEAALEVPDEAVAGSAVTVKWTGPDNRGDYITIVPKDTEDGKYAKYEYTARGNPVKVTTPLEVGPAEVRYMTGQGAKVLARKAIGILKADVSLKAAEKVIAGASVAVEWTGPDNQGDYITIVPKDTEDGKYAKYEYTRRGNPVKVLAPVDAGECEIRYMAGQGGKVLARVPLEVMPAEVSLEAADKAVAGAEVPVKWTGPDNQGDYITIVPKDTEDGKYEKYEYTKRRNPVKVVAPIEPGECEIRYMTGQGGKVLARIPLSVVAAEVTLKAADKATAGGEVEVEWTGPNNRGDYITVVPKDLEDGKYAKYQYTNRGPKVKIRVPEKAGACEIRYMAGHGDKVLARIPLEVVEEN